MTPEWEQDARDTEAGWAAERTPSRLETLYAELDPAQRLADQIDRADAAHDVIDALRGALSEALAELGGYAEWQQQLASDTRCGAGNPDGGSEADCEHCLYRNNAAHTAALIERLGAPLA